MNAPLKLTLYVGGLVIVFAAAYAVAAIISA